MTNTRSVVVDETVADAMPPETTDALAVTSASDSTATAGSTGNPVAASGAPTRTRITLPDGSRVVDDDRADGTLSDQGVYDASGKLILFKVFDASGRTLRATAFNADGSTITSVYANGVLTKTFTPAADGSRTIDDYNASGIYVLDRRTYDATGALVSFTSLGPNGHNPVVTETIGTPAPGADLVEAGSVAFNAPASAGAHTVSVSFDAAASGTAAPLGTLVPVVAADTAGGAAGEVDWTYVVPASQLESLNVGQSLKEVFDLTLTDAHGGTVVKPVTILLAGTNDAPTLGQNDADLFRGTVVDAPGALSLGSFLEINKRYVINDPDQGDMQFTSATFDAAASSDAAPIGEVSAGVYPNPSAGSYTVNWFYTVSYAELHALGAGHTVTEVYDVTVQDAHGATLVTPLTFTVTGSDEHPPVLSVGAQSSPLVEAGANTPGTSSATIQLTTTDPDYGEQVSLTPEGSDWSYEGFNTFAQQGRFGTALLDANTGLITYTLDDTKLATDQLGSGETATEDFSVTATDSSGASVSGTARFTIEGSNDAPVFVESAALGGLVRASSGSGGTPMNGASRVFALSPDGSEVAFISDTRYVVPGDTDSPADVFVKNLATGATTLLSSIPDSESYEQLRFSPDGVQLLFSSYASNRYDLFTEDLSTGAVTEVSTGSEGQQPNGDSSDGVFSADGRVVAFESLAGNLGAPAAQRIQQVYVKNLATGALTLASVAATGTPPNGESEGPSLSADGTEVAFTSRATNLTTGPTLDTGNTYDVFVKDLSTGAVTSLSSLIGAPVDALDPVISPDGTKVAFTATEANLLFGDKSYDDNAFVADLRTGTLTLLSSAPDGTQGNRDSEALAFSPDGTKVAFESQASNLIPGETSTEGGLFVKDLASGLVTRVSTGTGDTQANVADSSGDLSFAADGTTLAFISNLSDLVAGDTNNTYDVFVKDLTGDVAAVSTGSVTDDGHLATVSTTGTLPFIDVDSKDTHAVAVSSAKGDVGTLVANLARDSSGNTTGVIDWTYTVTHAAASAALTAGQARTDAFTVTVGDGHGGTAAQTVSVTLTEAAPAQAASAAAAVGPSIPSQPFASTTASRPGEVDGFDASGHQLWAELYNRMSGALNETDNYAYNASLKLTEIDKRNAAGTLTESDLYSPTRAIEVGSYLYGTPGTVTEVVDLVGNHDWLRGANGSYTDKATGAASGAQPVLNHA